AALNGSSSDASSTQTVASVAAALNGSSSAPSTRPVAGSSSSVKSSNVSTAPKALTLSWSAPTDNTDGSPLVDLKGYKIRIGTSSGVYTQTVNLDNAGLDRYVLDNLSAGTYYFAISAYNSAGTESPLSGEITTTL